MAITYVVVQNIANEPLNQHLKHGLKTLEQQIEWDTKTTQIPPPIATITAAPFSNLSQPATLVEKATSPLWKAQLVDGDIIGGESVLPSFSKPPHWLPGEILFQEKSVRDHNFRIAYTWVRKPENPQVSVLLMTAQDTTHRTELVNKLIKGMFVPQFALLTLAALLLWLSSPRGTAIFNPTAQNALPRSAHHSERISTSSSTHTLTHIMGTMSELLTKLTSNIEAQRRFVADAAHQLKTPLAGLRAQAELALRTASHPDTQANLYKIIDGTMRATRLTNQLLLMASAEHTEKIEYQTIDLCTLARHVCEQWVPAALDAHIDLGFEGSNEPSLIKGQPMLLSEALNNLIDNALRYVPSAGQVTVGVNTTANHVELSVRDTGPGIDIQDRDKIFDRFYRVLGTQSHGSGLGLAIVKEIAQRHYANIAVSDANNTNQPQGTQFTITFDRIISE